MNQSKKLLPSNSQVKSQMLSQAPSTQANTFLKGHTKEDANSVFFIDFNRDSLHHWGKKILHLFGASASISAEQTKEHGRKGL